MKILKVMMVAATLTMTLGANANVGNSGGVNYNDPTMNGNATKPCPLNTAGNKGSRSDIEAKVKSADSADVHHAHARTSDGKG